MGYINILNDILKGLRCSVKLSAQTKLFRKNQNIFGGKNAHTKPFFKKSEKSEKFFRKKAKVFIHPADIYNRSEGER